MIRLDDLQYQDLMLYQDTELGCFSEDAVLLSNFLRLNAKDKAVDLGSGNGIIAILGQAKTGASFTGVEQQPEQCALARQSALRNKQAISFYCMDVQQAPESLGFGTFTAATANPPYFADKGSCLDAARAMARHQEKNTLGIFFHAAFQLLKNGGKLFVCYPADQLVDLMTALRLERLEPKRIKLVLPDASGVPQRVLIEAKKDGKPGLRWEADA